jgi:hypothetical protein
MERCSNWFKEEAAFRVDESKTPTKGKKADTEPNNDEDPMTIHDID